MTLASEADLDDGYDEKHVDFREEEETLKRLREARTDEMFPDEVDTPTEQEARNRLGYYRPA